MADKINVKAMRSYADPHQRGDGVTRMHFRMLLAVLDAARACMNAPEGFHRGHTARLMAEALSVFDFGDDA